MAKKASKKKTTRRNFAQVGALYVPPSQRGQLSQAAGFDIPVDPSNPRVQRLLEDLDVLAPNDLRRADIISELVRRNAIDEIPLTEANKKVLGRLDKAGLIPGEMKTKAAVEKFDLRQKQVQTERESRATGSRKKATKTPTKDTSRLKKLPDPPARPQSPVGDSIQQKGRGPVRTLIASVRGRRNAPGSKAPRPENRPGFKGKAPPPAANLAATPQPTSMGVGTDNEFAGARTGGPYEPRNAATGRRRRDGSWDVRPTPSPTAGPRAAPVRGAEGLSGGDINEFPTGGGNVSKAGKTAKTATKVSKWKNITKLAGRGGLRVLGPIGVVAAIHEVLRGLGVVDYNRTTSNRASFGDMAIESMIRTLETGEIDREMASMPLFRELATAQKALELQQRLDSIGGNQELQSAIRSRAPRLIEAAQARQSNVGEMMDTVLARTGRRVIPSGLIPEEEF